QLGLLRRYADEVVSVFDADAAGQKATSRLEEMLTDVMDLRNLGWAVSRTGSFAKADYFPIKRALLPEGPEPDSLLRAPRGPALQDVFGSTDGVPADAAPGAGGAFPTAAWRGPAVKRAGVRRGAARLLLPGSPSAPPRGRTPIGPPPSGAGGAGAPAGNRAN